MLIIFLLILFICGCSSKEIKKDTNRNDDTTIEKKNDLKLLRGLTQEFDWNCDVDLHNIKDINIYYMRFIDNNGSLYEFDLQKKYSTTNNNCKKVDTEIKFDSFSRDRIISIDKKIYNYIDGIVEETGLKYSDYFDFEIELNPRYGIVNNNKVYDSSNKELYSFENGEEYINTITGIIKTNKAYYKYGIVNKKECNEYADIKCEYGIIKDDELTSAYDDIYYINKNYYILKSSNKIYTDILGG